MALQSSGQDSDRSEHMPKDVLRFGTVFRFLDHLFDTGDEIAFLRLLHPVTNKDNAAMDPQERGLGNKDAVPLVPYLSGIPRS